MFHLNFLGTVNLLQQPLVTRRWCAPSLLNMVPWKFKVGFPLLCWMLGSCPTFPLSWLLVPWEGSIQRRQRAIWKLGSAIMTNMFLLEKWEHPGRKKMRSDLWCTTGLACFWASSPTFLSLKEKRTLLRP